MHRNIDPLSKAVQLKDLVAEVVKGKKGIDVLFKLLTDRPDLSLIAARDPRILRMSDSKGRTVAYQIAKHHEEAAMLLADTRSSLLIKDRGFYIAHVVAFHHEKAALKIKELYPELHDLLDDRGVPLSVYIQYWEDNLDITHRKSDPKAINLEEQRRIREHAKDKDRMEFMMLLNDLINRQLSINAFFEKLAENPIYALLATNYDDLLRLTDDYGWSVAHSIVLASRAAAVKLLEMPKILELSTDFGCTVREVIAYRYRSEFDAEFMKVIGMEISGETPKEVIEAIARHVSLLEDSTMLKLVGNDINLKTAIEKARGMIIPSKRS